MRQFNRARPRSKGGRRSGGSVINRVFESSGPENKVRGNPQQIVEKYQAHARDAQLAGDHVLSENYSQHAEHYIRLLADAQEAESRRLQQDSKSEQRQEQTARPQTSDAPVSVNGSANQTDAESVRVSEPGAVQPDVRTGETLPI
ncbi:MAG: DUF4167 domain-containing protein [Rhodobacteraceae bacterium]|nr:DUF4167 domain-containing protein [Paracoccaceae bacterium]